MKIIARFLLILCATLTLAVNSFQAQNIESSIRIAHCRSMCLMNHNIDGMERLNTTTLNNNYSYCWAKCFTLSNITEEKRLVMCSKNNRNQKRIRYYSGIHTACVFYEIHGAEKDKYKASKLPAPEKCKTIHMKNHDVAVIMRKNVIGEWSEDDYYTANKISKLPEDAWIIVASEDGTLRHYSWEIWKPTLESLKKGDPLYQAHITWKDWCAQLEQQHQKAYPKLESRLCQKEKFVVTWQYETEDGIMGNQVTDSESAHISLPSNSKYLVRITTDDSPGSSPIVVDTRFKNFLWQPLKPFYSVRWLTFVMFPAITTLLIITFYFCRLLLQFYKLKAPLSNKSNKTMILLEEGRLTTTKKNDQKQCDSHICQVQQSISETITNTNLQTAIANSQKTKTNSRDINANLQNTKANL